MSNNPILFNDVLGDSARIFSWKGRMSNAQMQNNAQLLTKDLNAIFKKKFGWDNAFEVVEVTRKITGQMNYGYTFKKRTFDLGEKKEYFIVPNTDYNWNTHEYTKATFDVLRSKDMIDVLWREGGDPNANDGWQGNVGYNKGKPYSLGAITLNSNLSLFENVGSSKWTHGGVFLHETIWHKTELGYKEWEAPMSQKNENTMRDFFNLKTGNVSPLHKGGNYIEKQLSTDQEKERLENERAKTE